MKTVIEMARETGLEWLMHNRFYEDHLQRFAELVRADAIADENEACAKVCDEKVDAEYATGKVDHNEMGWTQACAIAIRARGNT